MIVIGIAGQAQSGKDTVSDYLVNHYGFHKVAFADPIKAMLKVGLKLSNEQLYGDLKEVIDDRYNCSPRRLQQMLGTYWGRDAISESIWVQSIKTEIEQLIKLRNLPGIVVSDVRFENEASMVREFGTLVHLYRSDKPQIDNPGHPSEFGVVVRKDDREIYNNGTLDQLRQQVDALWLHCLPDWTKVTDRSPFELMAAYQRLLGGKVRLGTQYKFDEDYLIKSLAGRVTHKEIAMIIGRSINAVNSRVASLRKAGQLKVDTVEQSTV